MVDRMNLTLLSAFAVLSTLRASAKAHWDERGQDTLEWVLMSGLIAGAIVGALVLFSGALTTMATNVGDCLDFNDATACDPGF